MYVIVVNSKHLIINYMYIRGSNKHIAQNYKLFIYLNACGSSKHLAINFSILIYLNVQYLFIW